MAKTYIGYSAIEGNADLDPLWSMAEAAAPATALVAANLVTAEATAATATALVQTNLTAEAATAAAATAAVQAQVTALPPANKYSLDTSAGPYVALAGELTGAVQVFAEFSGISGSTLTTRTAAEMIADAGLAVGKTYTLRLINSAGGTCTLHAGVGVTLTGHVAVVTDTFVDYAVSVTGAATMTFQSVGSGVAP